MTFAQRLVAGTILVVAIAVGVLIIAAERQLRRDLEADLARGLEREARLVREALPADPAVWDQTVRRLAAENESRITLIDTAGRIAADSDVPADSLARLSDHRFRPEVTAALQGATGTDVRESATLGRRLYYVAIPGGPGVVRVAASPEPVAEMTASARRAMLVAAVPALVLAAALALLAARSFTRPLAGITTAARAIAGGEAPRFPRSGVRDVEDLVGALRRMHEQLGDRFDAIRREKAESAALVDAMLEGVIAADARGRIVSANPAAHRLLGYASTDPLPVLPELFRAKPARELVAAVRTGASVEGREIDRDGRVLLVSGRPLPDGGAVLVLHDLTEVRRLEAVRRDFVANVSHELKTPLTSICGYAETLLADEPGPDVTRRFLEIIHSNGRRMQRLVDDLLDLSRIEAGRWQPEPEPVDVAALARDVWSALGDRAARSGVQLDVDAASGPLVADPDAVRQILVNLLDNALRFTPAGGRVVCRTRRDGDGTSLIVTDTGSGIATEHLPRVFERFYRADPSRSRAEGGTGLGLAIVKHLVEAHGGRVSVQSALGEGATFSAWFPAVR
jgi:two-component system, OmpR family, phosphate regulon sensor histidine kinase PhoR